MVKGPEDEPWRRQAGTFESVPVSEEATHCTSTSPCYMSLTITNHCHSLWLSNPLEAPNVTHDLPITRNSRLKARIPSVATTSATQPADRKPPRCTTRTSFRSPVSGNNLRRSRQRRSRTHGCSTKSSATTTALGGNGHNISDGKHRVGLRRGLLTVDNRRTIFCRLPKYSLC